MSILDTLCENLNLSQEMHDKIRRFYNEISLYLQEQLSQYDPDIFPQGSIKLGTAIRPLNEDDGYDLDFVCLLKNSKNIDSPAELKRIVGDALKIKYQKFLEEKDRCWRLSYNDFHVDILPAVLEGDFDYVYAEFAESENSSLYLEEPIMIPEKGLSNYQSSNPKGYAVWFQEQMSKEDAPLAFAESFIEPLPNYAGTSVLQNIVKIFKRHRDFEFKDKQDIKPISIIITTLAARYYNGETSIIDALKNTCNKFPEYINTNNIPNPVNPKENFADKWVDEPEKKIAFNEWLNQVKDMIEKIETITNDPAQGIKSIKSVLLENFEADEVDEIFERFVSDISEERKAGNLKVGSTGIIGVSGAGISGATTIKPNNFFGDHD